jgi:two-component system phosphate regulon sensor histidine kinase PhoR
VVRLVEDTVQLLASNAAEGGVTIRLELDHSAFANASEEAIFDGRALQRAVINLLDNAIKHSPSGSAITVGAARFTASEGLTAPSVDARSGWLRLWVADQGPGIPRAEHQKIFERFYRRGSELRRETPGVGIGLSIVKHIVEAHRGRVRVDSEPGQGSRFIIELPWSRAPEPASAGGGKRPAGR